MKWRGKLYIHSVLPFGLRQPQRFFNAMADALQCVMEQHGVREMVHYLMTTWCWEDQIQMSVSRSWRWHYKDASSWECRLQLGVPIAAGSADCSWECRLQLGVPIVAGSADCSWECQLRQLGEPIAAHKTEGPGEVITFLGIELDTGRMEVWLPGEKL